MTAITRADVEHLARLARLQLSEDELDHYAGQLDVILQSVARVSEVAADDIPPTSHPIPVENVYRDDVAMPGLDRATVAAGAPAWQDDRFRVPGTHFYETIRKLPVLGGWIHHGENQAMDAYHWSARHGKTFVEMLRRMHTGLLSLYVAWCFLGLAVTLVYLLIQMRT